jgi:hypothetical protein
VRIGGPAAAALMVVLGLVGLVAARPAAARAEPLQVSLDGQRWSARVDRPLFGSDRRWVPGDSETVPVWARNTSTDAARLTVQLLDRSGGFRLEDELQLTATVDGRPLTGTSGYPVLPGAPVRIDLTLAWPASAGNRGQQQDAGVTLRVTLTQLTGTVPPDLDGEKRPDRGLPDTGASVLTSALLVTGSVLLTTGAAVLGVGHRLRRTRGER